MRVIFGLIPGMGELALRRLTLTQNVTWPRWRLYAGLAIAVIAMSTTGTVLAYVDRPSDPLVASFYRPAILVIMSILAGAAVMAMEGSRDRSGSTERALGVLPLRRHEAASLVRLPSLCVAALVVLVPICPAAAALVSIGTGLEDALRAILIAFCAGMVTVAVPYLGVSFLMRSRTWDSVRVPTALVLWGVVYVWQVGVAFRSLAGTEIPAYLPLASALTDALHGTTSVPAARAICVTALVSLVAVAVEFSVSGRRGRAPAVLLRWHGHGAAGRALGEFRYALRDPALRANVALGMLMASVVVAGFLQLPSALRAQSESLVLLVVGVFAVSVSRSVRGIYPASVPVQRLLNITATSWASSTASVVAAMVALMFLPCVALTWDATDVGGVTLLLVGAWALAAALAVGVGAILPVGARNVLGHGVAGGLSIGGYITAFLSMQQAAGGMTGAFAGAAVALLVVAILVAVLSENFRWRPRSPRRGGIA
ncbi:hypothetical protein DZF97_00385 [Clavibacter nebraskensis]|uniref:Uncharacterized protein n=2 Tax=Clavibacter nebraskensis TaxID=31963 RepID=A0A399QN15_9MICO|nr:hypothetical protein DZF97_00385 [Clavibacter nebraskensis]